jgi:hypothetical protein
MALRDIIRARNRRRRALRQTLQERSRTVEVLLEARRGDGYSDALTQIDAPAFIPEAHTAREHTPRLKRYIHE